MSTNQQTEQQEQEAPMVAPDLMVDTFFAKIADRTKSEYKTKNDKGEEEDTTVIRAAVSNADSEDLVFTLNNVKTRGLQYKAGNGRPYASMPIDISPEQAQALKEKIDGAIITGIANNYRKVVNPENFASVEKLGAKFVKTLYKPMAREGNVLDGQQMSPTLWVNVPLKNENGRVVPDGWEVFDKDDTPYSWMSMMGKIKFDSIVLYVPTLTIKGGAQGIKAKALLCTAFTSGRVPRAAIPRAVAEAGVVNEDTLTSVIPPVNELADVEVTFDTPHVESWDFKKKNKDGIEEAVSGSKKVCDAKQGEDGFLAFTVNNFTLKSGLSVSPKNGGFSWLSLVVDKEKAEQINAYRMKLIQSMWERRKEIFDKSSLEDLCDDIEMLEAGFPEFVKAGSDNPKGGKYDDSMFISVPTSDLKKIDEGTYSGTLDSTVLLVGPNNEVLPRTFKSREYAFAEVESATFRCSEVKIVGAGVKMRWVLSAMKIAAFSSGSGGRRGPSHKYVSATVDLKKRPLEDTEPSHEQESLEPSPKRQALEDSELMPSVMV